MVHTKAMVHEFVITETRYRCRKVLVIMVLVIMVLVLVESQ